MPSLVTWAESFSEGFARFSKVQLHWWMLLLLVVDAFGLFLGVSIAGDGNWFFAIAIFLTLALINLVMLVPGLWPLRWISPALGLMLILSVYPLIYTVYVAFTNFSDGHRFTKTEALELLAERRYLPEDSAAYEWALFQNDAGQFALWLTNEDGESFFARPDIPLERVTPNAAGSIPATYDDYRQLEGGERFRAINDIEDMTFGDSTEAVGVRSANTAGAFVQQWVYDEETDTLTDRSTDTIYTPNGETGEFVAPNGETAPIGYWVVVGFENFDEILSTTTSQGPLLRVFLWTLGFAVIGSLTGFALGLVMAIILDGEATWLRLVRTLMIIPYAVPGLVSVLVWRGMLNANVGIIPEVLDTLFGWSPPFSTDQWWAKIAILLVNLWFAAPYFMLIASGALQSIPSSIYEAARVDGANLWVQFWSMTLPLVLVALGPLIIASIIFNFNNYFIMEGLFQGGPPIAGTSAPPVGHTDNLISYTYRLAFSAGGTRDYGLASALAVIIFMIVGALTLIQFRLMGTWEEVSENV
ncbi:MAG: ABC transporter permease subunit [Anaerolineales bacterium]